MKSLDIFDSSKTPIVDGENIISDRKNISLPPRIFFSGILRQL